MRAARRIGYCRWMQSDGIHRISPSRLLSSGRQLSPDQQFDPCRNGDMIETCRMTGVWLGNVRPPLKPMQMHAVLVAYIIDISLGAHAQLEGSCMSLHMAMLTVSYGPSWTCYAVPRPGSGVGDGPVESSALHPRPRRRERLKNALVHQSGLTPKVR